MLINAFNDIRRIPLPEKEGIAGYDDLRRIAALQVGTGNRAFKADQSGIWLGANKWAGAPFRVDMDGNLVATSSAITGVGQNFVSTLVWTATDQDTASWASGTIKTSDGTSYSIAGGNTGDIAATTYIYLDPATSITVLQTTTTAANAAGNGKILIAVIQIGGTGLECLIDVIGGIGTTIDGGKIITASLSSISANIGTITAGSITGITITGSLFRTAASGARIEIDHDLFGGFPAIQLIHSGGTYTNLYMGAAGTLYFSGNAWKYLFAGDLAVGGVLTTQNIRPATHDSYSWGGSTLYPNQILGNHLWYKTLNSFQKHDDITLIKNIKEKTALVNMPETLDDKNWKLKKVKKNVWDETTVPPEIYKEGFYHAGAVSGFLIGTLKQLIEKVEAIERKMQGVK